LISYAVKPCPHRPSETVDFLLRRDRGIATAQAFFRKALASNLNRWPRKVTLDGHVPRHRALESKQTFFVKSATMA
jgi:transposase-like protein